MTVMEVITVTAKKKIVISAICVAVVAGGTLGGYKINEKVKKSKAVAEVVPVSYMSDGYWGNEQQIEGVVSSGNVQTIKEDPNMLVEEIMVKEGDSVKKGTPIIKYDVTLLELDLKQKKNALAVAEDNINLAKKEITRLQGLQPSEALPPVPEPTMPPIPEKPQVNTVDNVIDATSAVSGNGSQNDPYKFNCNEATIVTSEFLNYIKTNNLFVEFDIYIDNTLSYAWNVSGENILDENVSDWAVGLGVSNDGMGNVSVDFSSVHFGSFKAFPASSDEDDIYIPEISEDDFYQDYIKPGSDNYIYSRDEISKMVSDKQEELKRLEIDKKAAEVEYEKAKSKNIDGVVKSSIDGVVTKVNDGSDIENTDSDILVIQGEAGLSITGSIGEYNLDKITEGTMISVTSYDSGVTAQAEVKSIDTTPVENYYNYSENPNSSGYSFTADISEDVEGFNVGEWVVINLVDNEVSDSIYLPLHYVREDNGSYYVFKAGEDGLLKKQNIKTGAIMYGSVIEVKSGLTLEDKICFPYGKKIKEGIKTKETDEVLY